MSTSHIKEVNMFSGFPTTVRFPLQPVIRLELNPLSGAIIKSYTFSEL